MLARQITFQQSATRLTLSPAYSYSLLALFLTTIPFIIKGLQPLLAKHPGVHTPRCLGPTPKFFVPYHIPTTPAFSASSALFCATERPLLPCFQWFAHSFNLNRGWIGSLNLVHRDSAQKLRIKVSRLLWQDFSRRRDAHHLLHIAGVQKECDLRGAAVHRIQRRRSFA